MVAGHPIHKNWGWKVFPWQSGRVILPLMQRLRAKPPFSKYSHRFLYLDVFPSIKLRADQHPSDLDCLHYCLPGPLDSWIIFLYNLIANSYDNRV